VNAPISLGLFNDSNPLHVEFKVDARKMEVKPDPKIAADAHAQIQKDMEETILESSRYPLFVPRASRNRPRGSGAWKGC